MASDHDARSPVPFEAPHGAKPGLQAPVVSFDPVVGVLGGVVKYSRQEVRNDAHQSVSSVGGDLSRLAMGADRIGEERSRSIQVTLLRQEHVDDLPILVNGPVNVAPGTGNLDVG